MTDCTGTRLLEERVTIVETPLAAQVSLRGDANDHTFAAAVRRAVGVSPPAAPNTSVSGGDTTILWLGPTEWLVTTATTDAELLIAKLRENLRGLPAAVIDVSNARVVLAVRGKEAREVLAKGCSLDLHPRVFRPGCCAQSLLAKAAVLLHQTHAELAYDIFVARSVAGYLKAWLADAAGTQN